MTLQTQGASLDTALAPPLATLTAHLPGTGGVARSRPEDFRVDELPAYLPAGEGAHLYLWVQKTGLPTDAVADALARAFQAPPTAVGYAGKKDTQAVTRQWFSVETEREWAGALADDPRWQVLEVGRHANKLRPGHLRGNRFTLVLRSCPAPEQADPILQAVREQGLPNYFGPQRVGPLNATALAGRRLLLCGRPPPRRQLERHRFALNAYQAALFNALVHHRLQVLGRLDRLRPGDLAVLHRNGAAFPVSATELATTQARADAREISPSAPLFGYRVDLAQGEPGAWEQELLDREGLTPESFRLGSKRISPRGERRPVRVFAEGLAWETLQEPDGPAICLSFELPAGSFATALLRELLKDDDLRRLPAPSAAPGEAP